MNRSLLDFAVRASVAVLPVLLAVLLAVGWLHPAGAGRSRDADQHVSARQLAALQTLERAIVRREAVAQGVPDAEGLLVAVPACRREWARREGVVQRVRRWLSPAAGESSGAAQRIAAQLAALDAALAAFSTADNRRVADAVGFDMTRWAAAVDRSLREPVAAPAYPGRTFTVQCGDIANAVALVARGDGRMLRTLAWRGTEVARTLARWTPEQQVGIAAHSVARTNPWAGLPGCVYLGARGDAAAAAFVGDGGALARRACAQAHPAGDDGAPVPQAIAGEAVPGMPPDDPRWAVPPSLSALLQSLAPLHRPDRARSEPNRVTLDGTPIDAGYAIDVTIEPALQSLAQRMAACYTGRHDVCRVLGVARKEDDGQPLGHRLLEGAMVRMAAIAIVDVGTGRIEALAGALSPCTREEYDGPGRSRGCDARLPYPIRYQPDALQNPAVFHDAMPASVIKPVLATAFLSDPDMGTRWLAAERAEMQRTPWPTRDSLRGQLMRSDSARFLDRMFCAERSFARCTRPWYVQAVAADFGWNHHCDAATADCGTRDLLFGGAPPQAGDDALAGAAPLPVTYGRLMTAAAADAPGAPMRLRAAFAFDPARVATCAAGPDGRRMTKDDWEKCRARTVVDMASEGWGQGNARVSALGVAGMMATLAAAANGDVPHAPHLVAAVRSTRRAWATPDATVAGTHLTPEIAQVVLSGLSYSHRAGTARLACEQVFAPAQCRGIEWIAGKTGTPTFPNDDVTLDELARRCVPGAQRSRDEVAACGALRPYKWYVAAYRGDPAVPRWSKAIAVLTERNWLADGRIHGAGDRGPNPAAEIALQIAARHLGVLAPPP